MSNLSFSNAAQQFFEYKNVQKKEGVSKNDRLRFDLAEGQNCDDQKYASLPDRQSLGLKQTLSAFLNVPLNTISIFAGADEIIEILPRLYLNPGESTLTVVPTFERMIATNYKVGGSPSLYSLKSENDFEMTDTDIVEMTIKANETDAKIIWLCTPNNPTGKVISLDHISQIAKENSSRLIVVNEVYQEYYSDFPEKSASSLIRDFPNILVIRSFSKAFGLAGARIGYVIASEKMIVSLELLKTMFSVSTPAQELACNALESGSLEKMNTRISEVRTERNELEKFIRTLDQFQVIVGSETNFFLIRHKTKDLFEELYRKGIVTSDWRMASGIETMGFVRVSINTRDLNQKLKDALVSIHSSI